MKTLCTLLLFLNTFYLQAGSWTPPGCTTPLVEAIRQWRWQGNPAPDYAKVKSEIAKAKEFCALEATDYFGNTAIHYTITANSIRGYGDLLRDLISAGSLVNARNKKGETLLDKAINFSLPEMVGILLEAKADFNIPSPSGRTPLDCAIENIYIACPVHPMNLSPDLKDKIVIAQTLLFAGATTKLLDPSRWPLKFNYANTFSALHCLAQCGEITILQTLANLGMYLHIEKSDGTIPLHEAGTKEVVQFFLTHGADVHALTTKKQTPLHTAKNREVALALLAAGANPIAQDAEGNTPGHKAVEAGKIDVVRALLEYKPVTPESYV